MGLREMGCKRKALVRSSLLKKVVSVYVIVLMLLALFPIFTENVSAETDLPCDPNPENNSMGVDIETNLFWDICNPSGYWLTYTLRFGLSITQFIDVPGLISKTFDPGTLNPDTTYYWQIVAYHGDIPTEGPIWSFKTGTSENPPSSGGLIGYWKFNEGTDDIANDSSGKGYDGTLQGGWFNEGKPDWKVGVSGSALEFISTNGRVEVGQWFDSKIENDFTISAWVNWYGQNSFSTNYYIFDNRVTDVEHSSKDGFILYLGKNNNKFIFNMNGQDDSDLTSTTEAPTESWVHIAVVFDDSSNTLRLFINGIQEDTNDGTNTHLKYNRTNAKGTIGNQMQAANAESFNGVIDEASIYNRSLSQEEIQNLYNKPGNENTIFSDDFNSDTLNSTKWKLYENITATPSNGKLTLTETSNVSISAAYMVSKVKIPQGTRTTIRFKQEQVNRTYVDSQYAGLAEGQGGEENCIFSWDADHGGTRYWRFKTVSDGESEYPCSPPYPCLDLSGYPDFYNYNTIEYVWDTDGTAKYYYNGELKAIITNNVPTIDLNVVFRVREGNAIVVDWVKVTSLGGLNQPSVSIEYSDPRCCYKGGNGNQVTIYANFSLPPPATLAPEINISTMSNSYVDEVMTTANGISFLYIWFVPASSDDDGTFTVTIYGSIRQDESGVLSIDSSKQIDNTNPTIESWNITTLDSATISWSAGNEPNGVNGTVEYGLTSSYNLTKSSSSYATIGDIPLTNLSTNTTYHYRIICYDIAGNSNSTVDQTFYTGTSYNNPTNNESATPDAGGPYSGTVNETIIFDGSGSTNSTNATIRYYKWFFGDGNFTGWLDNSASSHFYSSVGNYTVMLQIEDSLGNKPTSTTYAVIIANYTEEANLTENNQTGINISDENSIIIRVEITPTKELTNVVLTITDHGTDTPKNVMVELKKEDLPEPSDKKIENISVYRYVDITIKTNGTYVTENDIESTYVIFKVKKDWMQNNEIDNITLIRYHYDRWQNLITTEFTGPDYNYSYYIATLQGFSTFAVVGSKVVEKGETLEPEKPGIPWIFIIGFIIAGVVALIFVLFKAKLIYVEAEEETPPKKEQKTFIKQNFPT